MYDLSAPSYRAVIMVTLSRGRSAATRSTIATSSATEWRAPYLRNRLHRCSTSSRVSSGSGSSANVRPVASIAAISLRRFFRELGVEPVDYGRGVPVRIRALTAAPVDRALDVAGAGSLTELIELVGTADSVVTLADFGASTHGVRLSMGRFGGQPDGVHGLASAAVLADRGRFRVPVRDTYSAHQAAQAHETAARPP